MTLPSCLSSRIPSRRSWSLADQIKAGQNSYTLNDVFIISFLNFALVHDSSWEEKAVSSYSIREDSNGEKMTDALHFIFVELGRFSKELEDSLDDRDWWMYSLKNLGRMENIPAKDVPPEIRRLYGVTEVESLDEFEMNKYLQNMRTEFDIRTEKLMAREEGREEGREEVKGMIAKKMKSKGMSWETICELTGLPMEAIGTL